MLLTIQWHYFKGLDVSPLEGVTGVRKIEISLMAKVYLPVLYPRLKALVAQLNTGLSPTSLRWSTLSILRIERAKTRKLPTLPSLSLAMERVVARSADRERPVLGERRLCNKHFKSGVKNG